MCVYVGVEGCGEEWECQEKGDSQKPGKGWGSRRCLVGADKIAEGRLGLRCWVHSSSLFKNPSVQPEV